MIKGTLYKILEYSFLKTNITLHKNGNEYLVIINKYGNITIKETLLNSCTYTDYNSTELEELISGSAEYTRGSYLGGNKYDNLRKDYNNYILINQIKSNK